MNPKSLPKMLLVFLLFAGWCTNVIFASGTAKYEEGKVYEHILKNGMKVLTIERHIAPLIYHQLTYKVGSRNEKLGITGMSHVVEHMMFKGTQKYGKGEASKIISNNSGIFNAFTMNDMTSYYEYLPANKIEIAMDIESDRMQNAVFNSEEFTSEIEVIKQERRMRSESQANGILREMMNSVAYISSPNRDPVIGWPADLDNMTRDEAYAYYKTYYTPNNSFLLLIGDFETDEILRIVEKYYGNIPAGPEIPDVWSIEEKQKVRKSFTLHHTDITNPGMRMAFHAPVYTDADAAPLRLAGMILCERSRDARLYKRLVEKERIATVAAGGFGMSKDPGLFQISVALKPDSSVDRAEQMVWEEIEKMQMEPVTEHELQKVKNRYKYTQATGYTKNVDIGGSLSRYEAYFGWEFREEFDKRLLNVSQEDIMGVMNKYFAPHLVTVALSYPKKGSSDNNNSGGIKTDEIESYHFDDAEMFYYQPPVEAINLTNKLLSAELDEVIKPKPIYPLIHSTTLKNGIKLHVIQNHLVPTLSIIGTFETGNIPEAIEGEKPGIVTFMTDAMNRGSVNHPYSQVTERMAFVPFSFGLSGSYRGIYFQGNSLIENIDEMLSTGFDLLNNPTFLEEQLEKIRPQHLISARNRLKKTSMQAFYYMYNKLFEEHTLTKVNSTEETIKSITRDDLFDLHKKYIRPDNLTILIIGDLTIEQMNELAEKYFGHWSNESSKPEIKYCEPVKELVQKEIKVFTDNDYTECTINIGFSPFNNIDPDENEIVSVLNYILAGSALTSRMGIELRDKQGLIYGIKSELFSKVDNIGYWKLNTKTGPENTEKVIVGIFKEIRKLLESGITDEEIIDAKNRQIGLLPFYVETPDDAAGIVFDMIKEKLPFDHFDKKADRILAVTKEDVMRIAKKYFTLDNFIIVIDGPLDKNSMDGLIDRI